ncbi:CLUMA_CG018886, isoform A [Clunio marinus]|uniref:CLUMA_CG018886, isoform A n=1 Tax=Clunio marinus TaxID=568069 RepID=A0A1J1J347_9DIPT|nr:CLUMA_CG018886, isoform A [Clunio marinus]
MNKPIIIFLLLLAAQQNDAILFQFIGFSINLVQGLFQSVFGVVITVTSTVVNVVIPSVFVALSQNVLTVISSLSTTLSVVVTEFIQATEGFSISITDIFNEIISAASTSVARVIAKTVASDFQESVNIVSQGIYALTTILGGYQFTTSEYLSFVDLYFPETNVNLASPGSSTSSVSVSIQASEFVEWISVLRRDIRYAGKSCEFYAEALDIEANCPSSATVLAMWSQISTTISSLSSSGNSGALILNLNAQTVGEIVAAIAATRAYVAQLGVSAAILVARANTYIISDADLWKECTTSSERSSSGSGSGSNSSEDRWVRRWISRSESKSRSKSSSRSMSNTNTRSSKTNSETNSRTSQSSASENTGTATTTTQDPATRCRNYKRYIRDRQNEVIRRYIRHSLKKLARRLRRYLSNVSTSISQTNSIYTQIIQNLQATLSMVQVNFFTSQTRASLNSLINAFTSYRDGFNAAINSVLSDVATAVAASLSAMQQVLRTATNDVETACDAITDQIASDIELYPCCQHYANEVFKVQAEFVEKIETCFENAMETNFNNVVEIDFKISAQLARMSQFMAQFDNCHYCASATLPSFGICLSGFIVNFFYTGCMNQVPPQINAYLSQIQGELSVFVTQCQSDATAASTQAEQCINSEASSAQSALATIQTDYDNCKQNQVCPGAPTQAPTQPPTMAPP